MKHRNTTLVAAAILAATGPALAQSSGGGFDKPLESKRRWSTVQPQGRSSMTMRQQSDGRDVELRIEDGEMSATLNGKAVPEDQIRRKGNTVEILGEDGEVVTKFNVIGMPSAPRGIHAPPAPPQPPTGIDIPMAPAPPLKVMLGIRMAAPDDDLREKLDLGEGEGVLVEESIDGEPAHKAGVRSGDVIIEFDGERPVDAMTIRDVLEDKDVGDTVGLTVLRDGEAKRLRVTLGKYDPAKFATPGTLNALPYTFEIQPIPGMDPEEMRKLMEEHRKQFRGAAGGGSPRVWVPGEENGMQFFIPGGGDSATRAKLQELETRMKDLDKKLDRLNEQLDKLQTQLEKPRR